MVEFLALVSVLATVVIMPTTEPGIRIKDIQENSITLTAFEKNFDRVELYARGFCNKKGKQHILNSEESRNYYIPPSLKIYKYDCLSQSAEEAAMTSPSSEEVSAVTAVEEVSELSEEVSAETAVEEVSEPEKVISSECPSNIYVGQEQADGSWETVCKE